MRIPKMPKSNQYRVSVPALNGGVNLNDAPNLVEDNQLTAVLNMWWKDQALRTRAGLATTVERSFHIQTSGMGDSLQVPEPGRNHEEDRIQHNKTHADQKNGTQDHRKHTSCRVIDRQPFVPVSGHDGRQWARSRF